MVVIVLVILLLEELMLVNFCVGTGDADNDRDFEIKRYKYNLRLLNEDKPNSVDRDQRRYEVRTRAGHKFEMRDVGWAQANGGLSVCEPIKDCKSRQDEYDEPRPNTRGKNSVFSKPVIDTVTGEYFNCVSEVVKNRGMNRSNLCGYLNGTVTNPTNLIFADPRSIPI